MADRKISELTALTTPATGDLIPIVDVSEAAAADKNKSITVQELFKGVPDGTAAAPGLAFESDDGNGIFLAGTDQVGVATGGVERVEFGASEVVFNDGGANYDFRVEGDTEANLLFVDASTDRIGVGTASPTSTFVVSNGGAAGFEVQPIGTASAPTLLSYNRSGAAYTQLTHNALQHVFNNSGSEVVRIDSSGRLLIGTTTEGEATADDLTIATFAHTGITIRSGSTHTGNIYFSDATSGNGEYAGYIQYNHDGDTLSLGTANGTRLFVNSSGSVGIGVTDPGYELEVGGSSNVQVAITANNNAGNSQLYFGDPDNDDSGALIYRHTDDSLAFEVNSGEKVRITSSGQLLVGTSTALTGGDTQYSKVQIQNNAFGADTPAYLALSRSGTLTSTDLPVGRIWFGGSGTDLRADISAFTDGASSGSGDTPGRLVFSTTADGASSPTERMRIKADGASQFFSSTNTTTVRAVNGSSSGTSHRLFYGLHSGTSVSNGTAIYSIFTNGTVGTPSDIRLKKNVESTRDGYLDDIANLRVVKYHWKTQDDTEPKELGLIAQEVEQVFPGLIRTEGEGDDEVKEIKRSVIPFMLLKALQEANSKIEAQQVVINDLLARVTALEAN